MANPNLKWSPEVVRSLLDYVDEHKGPKGLFMTNLREAVNGAVEMLTAKYAPQNNGIFTYNKVYGTIGRLQSHASEDRFKTVAALYQFGTDILDLDLLPKGTFTDEEIAANHAIDTTSFEFAERVKNTASFTPSMIRVLLNVLEENKGEKGLFMRNRAQAMKLAHDELTKRVPAHKLNHVEVEQVAQKMDSFCAKASDRGRQGSAKKPQREHMYKMGIDILDRLKFETDVFSQEEINLWCESKTRQRPTKRARRALDGSSEIVDSDAEVAVALATSTTLTAFNGIHARKHGRILAACNSSRAVDTTSIASTMSELSASIGEAVRRRLQAAHIDTNQPVVINLEQLDCGVTELLENLLFRDRSELLDGLRNLDTMRASRHLPREVFIQSMVGVALTTWTLRPKPHGSSPNVHANIILRELYLRDPNLAAQVEVNALKTLFDEEITPQIKRRATDWAECLSTILARYMTPAVTNLSSHLQHGFEVGQPLPSYWSEFQEIVPQKIAPLEEATKLSVTPGSTHRNLRSRQVSEIGHTNFVADWKQALTCIFEKALKLRIDMEKKGGTYSFDFPTPGLRYLVSDKKGDPSYGTATENVVMLGLLPAINVRVKGSDGQLGDPISCAPLRAYSYN